MDDGSGGQGLLIIAIIVITFINWLSQTLKEKAAKKNAKRRAKKEQVGNTTALAPVDDASESVPAAPPPVLALC